MTTEQQLPEGWEYVPFNMFFNVVSISDKKISQKEYLDNGKYPVIDQGNLFIGGYSNDESLILKISSPVIVFGDHTKCFKYVSFPFVAGADGIKVLEPQNGIYPKYAYYYCLSIDLTDRGYSRHFAFLKKCQFLIAPIETQQAIVNKIESLFDEIDEGIGRLKAVSQWEQNGKEGKKPSKPSTLKKLESIEKLNEIELTELPDGWFWERLGLMTLGVEYGTSAKSQPEGKVPVLRMGNMQNGKIDWTDLVYSDNDEEIKQYLLKKGDVLFNRTNSPELVGKTSIIETDEKAIFAGYLIRINHLKEITDGRYLTYFLNSMIAKKYGNFVKTDGVNQSNINGQKLINYPFVFCSLKEQKEVADILEQKLTACDQLAAELSKQLKQADLLKQAVLKAAFSGSLLDK